MIGRHTKCLVVQCVRAKRARLNSQQQHRYCRRRRVHGQEEKEKGGLSPSLRGIVRQLILSVRVPETEKNEEVHVQGRLGWIPADGAAAGEGGTGNTGDAARRTLSTAKGKPGVLRLSLHHSPTTIQKPSNH